jgi:ABC-type transport system involved in cytochrome bd biosynthesis fused ATPase/permease subunit
MITIIIAFGVGVCVVISLTLGILTWVNIKETKLLDAEIKRLEKEYLSKYGQHISRYKDMFAVQEYEKLRELSDTKLNEAKLREDISNFREKRLVE